MSKVKKHGILLILYWPVLCPLSTSYSTDTRPTVFNLNQSDCSCILLIIAQIVEIHWHFSMQRTSVLDSTFKILIFKECILKVDPFFICRTCWAFKKIVNVYFYLFWFRVRIHLIMLCLHWLYLLSKLLNLLVTLKPHSYYFLWRSLFYRLNFILLLLLLFLKLYNLSLKLSNPCLKRCNTLCILHTFRRFWCDTALNTPAWETLREHNLPDILELVADFVKVLVHLAEAVPEAVLDLIEVRLEGVGHRGELPAHLVQMGCQRGVKRGFKARL